MTNLTLAALSAELADWTERSAASVVQVAGARRPASGLAHGPDTVITTARAIGREDGLRVRRANDSEIEADLAGWDPSSGIALLRTRAPLEAPVPPLAEADPRAGEIVLAIGRSWSNAVTASTGTVAVVGGPLRTGRRRQIDRVIRVTAPMHEGFAGGAVFDAAGRLAGIATAGQIRGFGVVIPAALAWAAATRVLSSGTPRRGFLGIAVQPVELPRSQRPEGRAHALLIVAVTPSSPADAAEVNVGDILIEVDGKPIESPDDLLDLLSDHAIGQTVSARMLRGGAPREVPMTLAGRT